MQDTGSEHVSHRIKRHERIENLDTDQYSHGDSEQADGQMAKPDYPLGLRGYPQSVNGRKQEKKNLNSKSDEA